MCQMSRVIRIPLLIITVAIMTNAMTLFRAAQIDLSTIQLPGGFRISLYADNIINARSMVMSPEGTLFIGTRKNDKVYAVKDTDGDFRADSVMIIASGLDMPNGVALYRGDLYVAENSRVIKFENIENSLDNPPEPIVVSDRFPADGHHGWKFIRFSPDSLLYVPVGAPCNICERSNPVYASIMRMKPDGSALEVFANGIRNTVGFDWHPETGVLWFTDNGRDWLGDNAPPDELNSAPQPGLHFGYPYCHGTAIPDPKFGEKRSCSEFRAPEQNLGPHVAALGMRFYTGEMFPQQYKNQIFIAEHGSWNRSEKIGYRITLVRLENGETVSYEPFATGWLQGETAWGRPVDVEIISDGSMLVSDDQAGAIYRIWYEKEDSTGTGQSHAPESDENSMSSPDTHHAYLCAEGYSLIMYNLQGRKVVRNRHPVYNPQPGHLFSALQR
jgi:glucose/arabinose dehydrogenase